MRRTARLVARLVARPLAAALALACTTAAAAPVEVHVHGADGRPLSGAVVMLESDDARARVRPMPQAEIAQVDKHFVPAVSVVTVGTSVAFPNRDTVRHHVYSFSEAKRFEIKLYVGSPEAPVVFDKPGIAVLGCNIHDQMAAWVVVADTPWHGRTADNGRWASDVPAGTYRLRTWHASLGDAPPSSQPLVVTASAASVTVKLSGDAR